VDDHKLFKTENNANARAFLSAYELPEETVERICETINVVSFSKNKGRIHDHTVSRKNPQYLVFVNPSKQFAISIDREHGGIELFEWSSGKWSHLGEFNYSGERTQEAGTKRKKHILNS
jgi:hypothetical protein